MRNQKRSAKIPDLGINVEPLEAYSRLLRVAISSSDHPEKDWLTGALRARRWPALLDWADASTMPQKYASAESYFTACQLSALIRKYPFSSGEVPGLDPQATATKKFLASEHRCRRVNAKYRAKRKRFDHYMQAKVYMRGFIEKVIGCKPDFDSISEKCDFTSGASILVGGSKTNIARKVFAQRWTATRGALLYAIPALWNNIQLRECILPGTLKCYDPGEFARIVREKVERTDYNTVSFVPKSAKTHRSIAVEPLLNGFLQKGADVYLREKLLSHGYDLSDQSRNQELALEGSSIDVFNPFVTIDLSAASDSLAIEVVRELLPPDWFEFLDRLRSRQYMLPGDSNTKVYEKFCSMGNGFCFPLQTLVFASVVDAAYRLNNAKRSEVAVYGDDIIVRQSDALLVIELLRELGFRTNVDKTFITGPFRESCGADWFGGQDVRPVHFDKPLVDVRQVFALHNSTLRSARCELFFEEFRSVCRSFGGSNFLRPGREPGDTAFSVPLDVAMSSPNVRWDRGSQGWRWKEVKSLPVADPGRLGVEEHANALLLAVMRGSDSRMPFALRYETIPKIKSVRRWYNNQYWGRDPVGSRLDVVSPEARLAKWYLPGSSTYSRAIRR